MIVEILIDTINHDKLHEFVHKHKSKFDDCKNEKEIRKQIFECVLNDKEAGIFVYHEFDYDGSEPYTLQAVYMDLADKSPTFVVESYVKNNEHFYKTHDCEIVASSENLYLLKYFDTNCRMNTLLSKHNVFPISDKIIFEKRVDAINNKRKELLKLDSNLYEK